MHNSTSSNNESRTARLPRLLYAPLSKIIGFILTAVFTIVFMGRFNDWWIGPDSYYIYLVGDHANNPVIADIFTGFRGGDPCDGSDEMMGEINGVAVKAKCVDDEGDLAMVHQITNDLVHSDDTLMIIGHGYSTTSKEALPSYLHAQPPIPVFLTTETNPRLIPTNTTNGEFKPVYRLWPTDDEQAEKFAQFALDSDNPEPNNKVLWVVEDEQNPIYANNLAQNFIKQVQEKMGDVILRTTNMSVPPSETLNKLNIDFIFFAGGWRNALILIKQIKQIFPPNEIPSLLLSDQAADPQLLTQGENSLDGLCVFFSFPLKAERFQNNGFKLIGEDARSIVNVLLEDTDRYFIEDNKKHSQLKYWSMWLLNRHEVADARTALLSSMQRKAGGTRVFKGKLKNYQFINNGSNISAQWHIWTIVKKDTGQFQFVDVNRLSDDHASCVSRKRS